MRGKIDVKIVMGISVLTEYFENGFQFLCIVRVRL